MPTFHEKCKECGALLTPRSPGVPEGWCHYPSCARWTSPPPQDMLGRPTPQFARHVPYDINREENVCGCGSPVESEVTHIPGSLSGEEIIQTTAFKPAQIIQYAGRVAEAGKVFTANDAPAHDPVYAPRHYTSSKIAVVDAIEAWNLPAWLAICVQYIARESMKGGIEDLRKAQWYLAREIKRREEANDASEPSA